MLSDRRDVILSMEDRIGDPAEDSTENPAGDPAGDPAEMIFTQAVRGWLA